MQGMEIARNMTTTGPGPQPDDGEKLGDDDAPHTDKKHEEYGGSLFHERGAACRKKWFVILTLEYVNYGWRRVTNGSRFEKVVLL